MRNLQKEELQTNRFSIKSTRLLTNTLPKEFFHGLRKASDRLPLPKHRELFFRRLR